jgi:hypothetical protein
MRLWAPEQRAEHVEVLERVVGELDDLLAQLVDVHRGEHGVADRHLEGEHHPLRRVDVGEEPDLIGGDAREAAHLGQVDAVLFGDERIRPVGVGQPAGIGRRDGVVSPRFVTSSVFESVGARVGSVGWGVLGRPVLAGRVRRSGGVLGRGLLGACRPEIERADEQRRSRQRQREQGDHDEGDLPAASPTCPRALVRRRRGAVGLDVRSRCVHGHLLDGTVTARRPAASPRRDWGPVAPSPGRGAAAARPSIEVHTTIDVCTTAGAHACAHRSPAGRGRDTLARSRDDKEPGMAEEFRTARDTMGEMQIPIDALWGASTQRAVENFPISGQPVPVEVVHAHAMLKWAAATANEETGVVDAEVADAIRRAADEVIDGQLDDQFPVDVFQTGLGHLDQHERQRGARQPGEAAARRGSVLVAGPPQRPRQRLAVVQRHVPDLRARRGRAGRPRPAAARARPPRAGAAGKADAWSDVVKSGRTHLMDATPVTLGQEFGGYARQIELGIERVERALTSIYELALGGTAVGTGLNCPPGFVDRVIGLMAERTGLPFRRRRTTSRHRARATRWSSSPARSRPSRSA